LRHAFDQQAFAVHLLLGLFAGKIRKKKREEEKEGG